MSIEEEVTILSAETGTERPESAVEAQDGHHMKGFIVTAEKFS